jgi:TM2 domain-containing membrane protein YozV
MKKLICEMCKSADIVKEDGVFVCQSCGTKYSVEEAKKMMVDGTEDEAMKVKVDNSAKLDNLYTLARRAKEENNSEKAAQYYEQILQESPHSWEAMFYSNFYAAVLKWRNGEKIRALTSLQNCIGNVVDIICGSDERAIAVLEIYKQLKDYCEAVGNANEKTFNSFLSKFKSGDAAISSHNDRILEREIRSTLDINIGIAQILYIFGASVCEKANAHGDLNNIIEYAMTDAKKMVDRHPCFSVFVYDDIPYYNYTTTGFGEIKESIRRETDAKENALKNACDMVVKQVVREKREKWEREHPEEAKKQREEQEEKEGDHKRAVADSSAIQLENTPAVREVFRGLKNTQGDKRWPTLLFLSVLLGLFGVDRFYVGKVGTGILKLITGGGWGVWWIIDMFFVVTGRFTDAKGNVIKKQRNIGALGVVFIVLAIIFFVIISIGVVGLLLE